MATEPFLGEIRAIAFNFPPRGWAFCNGQILSIQQNQALFAILGTTYGGNGTTTFALPNLQGRVPIHMGASYTLGQTGGVQSVTLTTSQIGHGHNISASASADQLTAGGHFPGAPPSGNNIYAPGSDTAMDPTMVSATGGSQPHNNLQPYLVLNYVIALQGIFPSRN